MGQHLRVVVVALISTLMMVGIVNLVGTFQDLFAHSQNRLWQVVRH